MNWLLKAKHIFLALLFPPVCLNCDQDLGLEPAPHHLCDACFRSIEIHTAFFCPVCARRLPDSALTCHLAAGYVLAAATDYQNSAVRTLIWHFKYQKWRTLHKILGDFLTRYLKAVDYDTSEYNIVPIPLHPSRQRERGFNQAELLSRYVSEKLSLPVLSKILIRQKPTHTQTTLKDKNEKEINVAGCFHIADPAAIRGKKIIVVDDVYTSGATMNEAVRVLKSAGAKKIIALVAAKAH